MRIIHIYIYVVKEGKREINEKKACNVCFQHRYRHLFFANANLLFGAHTKHRVTTAHQ